jgi:uncharacterized protein YraI
MRLTPHLVSLGILLGATAGVMAKPAYVASTVNLRAAPGTTSGVVRKIPGGSLVNADNCSEGWCAVTWQDNNGFAIQSALDMSGRVPRQRAARSPRYPAPPSDYVEGPDYVVEGPLVYYQPALPYYYGYGPYYRRHSGWRRHW